MKAIPVLLLAGATVLVFGGLSAGDRAAASAAFQGRPGCADLGPWPHQVEVDPFVAGSTAGSGNTVVVSNVRAAGGAVTFDWSATTAVAAVYVRAGDGGTLFTYDPPQLSETGVRSPRDPISSVAFCWSSAPPATTTTTIEVVEPGIVVPADLPPAPTPTPSATPTPTPAATPEPTSTTTTTSSGPAVAPSDPAAGTPSAVGAAPISTSGPTAPATGARMVALVVLGLGMLGAGGLLLVRGDQAAAA